MRGEVVGTRELIGGVWEEVAGERAELFVGGGVVHEQQSVATVQPRESGGQWLSRLRLVDDVLPRHAGQLGRFAHLGESGDAHVPSAQFVGAEGAASSAPFLQSGELQTGAACAELASPERRGGVAGDEQMGT